MEEAIKKALAGGRLTFAQIALEVGQSGALAVLEQMVVSGEVMITHAHHGNFYYLAEHF